MSDVTQTIETVTNYSDTLVVSVTVIVLYVLHCYTNFRKGVSKDIHEDEKQIRKLSKEEAIKVVNPVVTELKIVKKEMHSIRDELHHMNDKLDKSVSNGEIIGRELSKIGGILMEHVRKDDK